MFSVNCGFIKYTCNIYICYTDSQKKQIHEQITDRVNTHRFTVISVCDITIPSLLTGWLIKNKTAALKVK